MIYMAIAPRHFYARVSRWVAGKSPLVPSPVVFSSSLAALFIFSLLPSEDLKVRLILILAIVTSPIWIYALIAIIYVVIYSSRPMLHYIWRPYWTGPELRIMFSVRALSRLDLKLLIRALFYFVPHAIVGVGIVLTLPLGILLWFGYLNRRPGLAPSDLTTAFCTSIYLACSVLTWAVVMPASYLVLFCSKIPTADVLRLTIFRDLIKLFQETDNLRFTNPARIEEVRHEWRRAVGRLCNQERKILLLGSDSFAEYLRERSEVFLEPLYRCLDSKGDAAELAAIRTITGGNSLLSDWRAKK